MSIRPFRDIKRKITKEISVGEVKIGAQTDPTQLTKYKSFQI